MDATAYLRIGSYAPDIVKQAEACINVHNAIRKIEYFVLGLIVTVISNSKLVIRQYLLKNLL